MRNGCTSHWLHQLGVAGASRTPLPGDRDVDVAIVGGGFTGLWTAYWLTQNRPDLSVAVLESRHVGYGASGRNGGWLSGKMVGLRRPLAAGPRGKDGVVDLQRACFEAIDEVLALMRRHGHDVDAVRGGYLQVARTPAELRRVHRAVAADREWGLTEADVRMLDAEQLRERVRVRGALGAQFSPHNATLNPAKLVTALAAIVEAAGVAIYEGTRASAISPGEVATDRGRVRADVVLRATEGYTPGLPRGARELLPMNSSMIATEPIPEERWEALGWQGREGLSGASHRYFYAQRTADNRIALGGRGLPYRFGSRVDRDGQLDPWTIRQLRGILEDVFGLRISGGASGPGSSNGAAKGGSDSVRIDHAWCGVLGVPRDWTPSVRYDPGARIGAAGGYVGQGVTAAYVAGRTLADLVTGEDSRFSQLPWANRRWRAWEPEPLRFLGAYTMYGLYQAADGIENRRRAEATSVLARLADTISGRH
ncbi:MAG: NAD(P)/FAD-dependent oxidoreductase [Micromonosporaceae bacterium]